MQKAVRCEMLELDYISDIRFSDNQNVNTHRYSRKREFIFNKEVKSYKILLRHHSFIVSE